MIAGLTDAEVAQRVAEGKSNAVAERATRSIPAIVRANVFTRINAILGVLLIIVLATGSVINGLFGLLIVANSVIGMVQEIRAKQTLDKLAIVGQAKPLVRRQSGTQTLIPSEVVLDDIIELGPGDQIVVDGEIVEEENLEVDESLLTGEADPITKAPGDAVMSGSFVVTGVGAYRATRVGPEAYAAKLAEEASKFTLVKSELRNGINRILQFVTYLLVPAGLLTIYTQLFTTHVGWRQSVLRTVGALVPMVPEGLVLLTSVAFAVGVIRLGQRQCLVQELPAIEGLARVDVVCADKTGTLTENGMRVSDVSEVGAVAAQSETVADVLASLAAADARPNASMQAIAETFDRPPGWIATATAPFKSATKWSGVSYRDHGNWVIGAPDVLLDPASAVAERAERIGAQGLRVLLLGRGEMAVDHPDAPGRVTPVALVVLEQKVRPDARETLDYFAAQDVSVKVISGDNAVSVGAVAGKLGLHGETDGRASTANRPGRTGRHAGHLHHLRPGAARPETRHRARAAIARPHRGDDRRRRQRCARPQGCRYRCRDGRRQPGVARGGADRPAGQQVCHAAICRRRGPAGDRQHRAGGHAVSDQDGVLGAAGAVCGHRMLVRPNSSRPIPCCTRFSRSTSPSRRGSPSGSRRSSCRWHPTTNALTRASCAGC